MQREGFQRRCLQVALMITIVGSVLLLIEDPSSLAFVVTMLLVMIGLGVIAVIVALMRLSTP